MKSLGILSIGKGTITLDYELGTVIARVSKPENKNIWDHWQQEFSSIDKITCYFSSGIDSQFSLLLANKYCSDVTAVTFQFNWEDDIVNASDILLASKFCKQHNIKHVIEQIDLKDFLTNHLEDFARDHRTPSPQISAQLYGISKSKYNDRTIILGGEVPYIGFLNDKVYSAFEWRDPEKTRINQCMYFKSFMGPFAIYSHINQVDIIRDPFTMTPEIYYLATAKNMDVLKEHNKALNLDAYTTKRSFWDYKKHYYSLYDFDYLVPLKKRTGFETLKTHLASETGVYNQFDLLYRKPLVDIHDKESWFGAKQYNNNVVSFTSRNQFQGDLQELLAPMQDYYDENSIEFCNTYTLEEM